MFEDRRYSIFGLIGQKLMLTWYRTCTVCGTFLFGLKLTYRPLISSWLYDGPLRFRFEKRKKNKKPSTQSTVKNVDHTSGPPVGGSASTTTAKKKKKKAATAAMVISSRTGNKAGKGKNEENEEKKK